MPRMNQQTKLVFALEHIAHLYDLIEDNEYQESLTASLSDLERELERQLAHEFYKNFSNNYPVFDLRIFSNVDRSWPI